LIRFVETGGAVLAFPGPRTLSAAWNRPADGASQLFGFELRQPSSLGDWRIDPLRYASPIAKPFANYLDAGLLTTPVFRYWQIAWPETNPLVIDLGFTTGDPCLVRRRIGRGWTAALLSTPQSGSQAESATGETWNAMATWPSFLPIMQKITETIIGGSEATLNLYVGQSLRGSIAALTGPTELTVRRPDNSQSRLTLSPSAEGWSIASTERAGIYQVASGETIVGRFAVNVNPVQSDLQSVSLTSLPLSPDQKELERSNSMAAPTATLGQSEAISHGCLVALLVVLALESILAWNLGRRLT
jgi:hypothetical protein